MYIVMPITTATVPMRASFRDAASYLLFKNWQPNWLFVVVSRANMRVKPLVLMAQHAWQRVN